MKTKHLVCPDGKRYAVDVKVDKHGLNGYQYHVVIKLNRKDTAYRYKTFAQALNHYMSMSEKERMNAEVRKVATYDIDMALERDVTFIDGCIRTVKGSPHEDYYNKRRKRVTDLRNKVKVAMMCFVGQEGEG